MRPIASCASSTAETFFAASAADSSTAVTKLHCDLAKAYSGSDLGLTDDAQFALMSQGRCVVHQRIVLASACQWFVELARPSRLTAIAAVMAADVSGRYAAPIRMPTPSTIAPPSTIWYAACRNGVSMYLARMKAIAHNSKNTTMPAITVAIQNALGQESGTRKGMVWPTPPSAVITPLAAPRSHGEPRPLSAPSSDNASAKPMLMPAPIEAARPTRNVCQF